MNYSVGDVVLLRDNWLTENGRMATIMEDKKDGWFVVHVDTTYPHDFCADEHELLTHCSMFLPYKKELTNE